MNDKKPLSFEMAMAQLEEILQAMNSEETSLEESIRLYARAAQLVKESHSLLEAAEVRIQEIDEVFAAMEDEE